MRNHAFSTVLRNRQGTVSIFVGLSAFAMVLLFLGAIDMMRINLVRSRVWAAMDSAVLAAGRDLGSANALTEGTAYFNANMISGYMGASIESPVYTCEDAAGAVLATCPSAAGSTLTMSIKASIPLYVLAKLTPLSINITNSATRRTNPSEVVLVLDNTGSMGSYTDSGSKISALRTDATALVTDLLGNGGNAAAGVYVGLVPFTETVKVGNSAVTQSWLDSTPAAGWLGCLNERKSTSSTNFTFDDTPPAFTANKFTPYYDTKCPVKNKVKSCSQQATQNGCQNSSSPLPKAPTQFLTSSTATLTNAIQQMDGNGNTLIGSGLLWGWRMLSTNWQGLWGVTGHPLSVCANGVNANCASSKVIVLLTDGDNDVNSGSPYTNPYGDPTTVPPYGNLVGTDNANANTLLLNACSAAKASGIIIYTIGLDTNGTMANTTKNLLKSCATQSSYYFYAPSTTALATTFTSIAGSLSKLQLTQ